MAGLQVHALMFATTAAAILAACSFDMKLKGDGNGSNGMQPLPGVTTPTGVPCDVAQVLASPDGECTACHSSPPNSGAPMSLVSYADLMAPSPSNASINNAQAALQRMQNAMSPMPPSPMSMTPAELQTFQTWVNAGMPQQDCGSLPPPPPSIYDTPHACTHGQTLAQREGSTMLPGDKCVSCHAGAGGEAPPLTIGGTVFFSAHEPINCNGVNVSGAGNALEVQIFDATVDGGTSPSLRMAVNSIGNFYSQSRFPSPFTAKVVDTVTGTARAMATHQTSGDCNACHSENGDTSPPTATTPKAPGRIMAP